MKPRILFTGFTEFGGYGKNASQALMEQIDAHPDMFAGCDVRTAILDVDYKQAGQQWLKAYRAVKPDLAVAFGLSWGIDEIKLERIALNLDDCELPDNSSVQRLNKTIFRNWPLAMRTLLPIDLIHAALLAEEIPARTSNHAGAYLCNHIFYFGLRHILNSKRQIPFGFIHLPPLPEQLVPLNRPVIREEQMLRMVQIVIEQSLEGSR